MVGKFKTFITGLLFISCNLNSEVKVSKSELKPLVSDRVHLKTKNHNHMTFDEMFSDWINEIIKTEQPNKKVIAYKFGIFETPDVPSGYYLYLIGANHYDPKDDDWAAGFGDFKPNSAYLALPEKEFKNLKWEKVQTLIEKRVKQFVKSEDFKNSFFNDAKAIAVGFDDGDLVRIR